MCIQWTSGQQGFQYNERKCLMGIFTNNVHSQWMSLTIQPPYVVISRNLRGLFLYIPHLDCANVISVWGMGPTCNLFDVNKLWLSANFLVTNQPLPPNLCLVLLALTIANVKSQLIWVAKSLKLLNEVEHCKKWTVKNGHVSKSYELDGIKRFRQFK